MSQMEQEDDIADMKKNRQTREEVRRRNREVMQRANAELREGKSTAASIPSSLVGKRDTSRLPLIRQFRDGTQQFLCDFRFHTSTPELSFGPLKVDMDVKASDFCDFSLESAASMFGDCLKNICMIDEALLTHLDLINPEETYRQPSKSVGHIDSADETLLTNELTNQAVGPDGTTAADESSIYTGHFLRKPQLMSNDLFAEGAGGGISRKVGGSISTSMVGRNRDRSMSPEAFDMIAREFDEAKHFDRLFSENKPIDNPISKTQMRAKRVLAVVPDDMNVGEYNQFKFVDEKVGPSGPFEYFMSHDFCLYEQTASDFPKRYRKKRHLVRSNRNTVENAGEDFLMIRVPVGEDDRCRVKPVGSKVLLKKDIRVAGTSHANESDVILHAEIND